MLKSNDKISGLMKTLVILHGWGQSSANWQIFTQMLGDIQVVLIDLPGFGKEPLIDKNWGVPEYAQWAGDRIASLGKNEVVLLGHSFGGRIASLLACENHTWLKGLILYGSPSIYRPTTFIKFMGMLAKVAKRLGLRRKKSYNLNLTEADRTGLGEIFRKVVPFDQTSSLGKISVPTLLIWGEKDTEVPLKIACEMKELIPQSKLKIMPGLGHNAHLENPNLFYGLIKKFLETI